ncbi:hypothetical protein LTR62_002276 [Meristemomyces frigidus]|uniref:Conidiation-specific protein 10 n=1 Tax=Meristemomyces frigidus TaxID=1508187 RepID=A0AAN7TMI4_9PEZI|nr:hypothetical protein LTR62_002276 [Meristemomyces frigidus]
MSTTKNTNPGNFANRSTEEVKEVASMGGRASHRGHEDTSGQHSDTAGRNANGSFTKGSEAAKEAGHKGGMHSHDHDGVANGDKVTESKVEVGVSMSFNLI